MMWWVAQNLVVAALMVGVVWMICKMTRIGPAARHMLWLVVLIKMVTPPLVVWPWGVHDLLAQLGQQPTVDSLQPAPGPIVTKSPLVDFVPLPVVSSEVVESVGPMESVESTSSDMMEKVTSEIEEQPALSHDTTTFVAADSAVHPTTSRLNFFLQFGIAMWIAGAAFFALIQIIRIVRMSLRLRGSCPPDETVAKQIAIMTRQLEMRPVETRVVAGIGSPFIWAFAKPRLLWPAELPVELPQTALQGLIVHELAHVKRRDHWVGWLELVAGCIWWWNPLFWYARHQLRENAELACDAWVVGTLPAGRRAYAEALLAVCECVSKLTAPIPAVGATASGRHAIERRLNMILRGKSPFRLSRGGLFAALALAATALPAWSQTVETGGATPEVFGFLPVTVAPLPAEARTLFEEYEQQEADLRREAERLLNERRQALIDKLQAIQDRYAREGLLDEAVAVRDEIRKLRTQTPVADATPRSGAAVPPSGRRYGPTIQSRDEFGRPPNPRNLVDYRDRVGQVLPLEVIGSTEGTVWGSGIYTDDSDLGTAAVHAGLLRPRQIGVVYVAVMPGQLSYGGSARNGVTSSGYPEWPGSYRFVLPPVGHRLGFKAIGRDCTEYRGEVGKTISIPLVIGDIEGVVWGSGVYTDDSSLGAAAVHAGILNPGEAGNVMVKILPGRESYEGSTKNGVTSRDYGPWEGSFQFVPSENPAKTQSFRGAGMEMRLNAQPGGSLSKALLQAHRDIDPAQFATGSRVSCIDCHKSGAKLIVDLVGSTKGSVWGSDVYTDDSSLEAAAVHAGALKDGESGAVRIIIEEGKDEYEESTRNGVTSRSWRDWPGSFRVEAIEKVFVPAMKATKRIDQ